MTNREIDFKDWYKQELDELSKDPEYIAQDIMLDLAIQISNKLDEEGLSQKDLAHRLGVSEGWISRFMNVPTNWSIEKLVKIGGAVGLKLTVTFEPELKT